MKETIYKIACTWYNFTLVKLESVKPILVLKNKVVACGFVMDWKQS